MVTLFRLNCLACVTESGSDLNDPVALTQWSGGDQKSFALIAGGLLQRAERRAEFELRELSPHHSDAFSPACPCSYSSFAPREANL